MAIRKPTRTGEAGLVADLYFAFRKAAATTLGEIEGTRIIAETVSASLRYLATRCEKVELRSRVAGKRYFAFRHTLPPHRISRPINADLFIDNSEKVAHLLKHLRSDSPMSGLSVNGTNCLLYTASVSFCAFCDATAAGDKKTPGTYFELLVGHVLSLIFGVKPRTKVEVLTVEDERSTLRTDLIFDLGQKKFKFHVPVKISTRERAIQVWAHQRILNGVYGDGRFRGILVSLAETKLDLAQLEVTEICTPEQWAVYQRFIARMDRVYYLDPPSKYAVLAEQFPFIPVKTLGEFFKEKDALVRPLSY
jgi:hypothetical protein